MSPLLTIIFVHVVLSTPHVVDTQGSLASLNSATKSRKSEFSRAFRNPFFCVNSPQREFCGLALAYLFSRRSHHSSVPTLSNNPTELQFPQSAVVPQRPSAGPSAGTLLFPLPYPFSW